MPIYAFKCEKCDHQFEESLTMAKNDVPLKNPCPSCKANKVIRDYGSEAVGMAMDATLSPNKATGGAWNELMSKMKPGMPKRFRRNLDAATERRGGS
jgi:putative FmdB family regulatory protein